MRKAFLWAALLMAAPLAQAAAIGGFLGDARILGTIRPGDYEEVQHDFAKGFAIGLRLKVDPDSAPFETMRIGLWLAERRPALMVQRDCIGPCASFLLTSGSSVRIDKGTLIAFSVKPEWESTLRDRIREGDLFIDQELSQLSRARLLERFKLSADASALMRDAADRLMPAPAVRFMRAVTMFDRLDDVFFDEERYSFNVAWTPGHCIWWVPDAVGLAQLGVHTPAYEPVDRARAAKLLKVDPRVIYIGPVVDPIPEGGLCPLS